MAKEYDLATAAKLVKRNPSYLRKEALLGRLKAHKMGGSYIVRRSDLLSWFEGLHKRHKPGAVPLEIEGE